MNAIVALDKAITSNIAQFIPHNWFFDHFFSFLSLEGLTIIAWLLIGGIILFIKGKEDKRFISFFLISFIATYFIVNVAIKNIVQRPRPWVAQRLEITTCPNDFSFPSGHAAGAFSGAVILATFDKKRRSLYYGIAFLISLSRIYLICHYFGDVFFGALIGFFISKLILHLHPITEK